MNYEVDWNADGGWSKATELHLRLWYMFHVDGNPNYPTFEIWIADMIKMNLIKEVME